MNPQINCITLIMELQVFVFFQSFWSGWYVRSCITDTNESHKKSLKTAVHGQQSAPLLSPLSSCNSRGKCVPDYPLISESLAPWRLSNVAVFSFVCLGLRDSHHRPCRRRRAAAAASRPGAGPAPFCTRCSAGWRPAWNGSDGLAEPGPAAPEGRDRATG